MWKGIEICYCPKFSLASANCLHVFFTCFKMFRYHLLPNNGKQISPKNHKDIGSKCFFWKCFFWGGRQGKTVVFTHVRTTVGAIKHVRLEFSIRSLLCHLGSAAVCALGSFFSFKLIFLLIHRPTLANRSALAYYIAVQAIISVIRA